MIAVERAAPYVDSLTRPPTALSFPIDSVHLAIFNRAADNWEPLLAIGEAAGSEVAARARKVALAACDVEQEQSIGTLLLADNSRRVFGAERGQSRER